VLIKKISKLLTKKIKFAAQFTNRADQKNKQIADQKNKIC
jgi:hypothetical protein